jgi:virulence factor
MTRIRVALIGAGKMANTVHYPSLAGFDDVEMVGLCDLDAGRLAETARTFNIPRTFGDYRRMLDETAPDAVCALMPPHQLFDVAADVLERGKHLFIEKPPALTTFQTECLARLATDRGVVTAVGFQRRYHPLLRRCWEEVTRKGPVQQTVACFYKNVPPSDQHPYFRGAIDILRCDAIHAVDALRFYCGLSPVKAVASEVRNLDAWYANSFNAIVHFENGAVGVLLANWRVGRRFFKCEFHACGASAFADTDGRGDVWIDNHNDPALSLSCTEAAGAEDAHRVQGFQAENRAFIDAVRTGTSPHNSLPDAVETMRLADLIYANAINTQEVTPLWEATPSPKE